MLNMRKAFRLEKTNTLSSGMQDLPLIDPIYDAENLIKQAQSNKFFYITKEQLNPHILSSAAKHLLINYSLITKSEDNDNIYYLTERGRNFKSFADETQKALRKEQKEIVDLRNSERIFKTYWWTFGIAVAAFLISLCLLFLKLAE